MLCISGKIPVPQLFNSLPSRLKTRTGGSMRRKTRMDPLPSAATDTVSPHSGPSGGSAKGTTAYLGFDVWANTPPASAQKIRMSELNFSMEILRRTEADLLECGAHTTIPRSIIQTLDQTRV